MIPVLVQPGLTEAHDVGRSGDERQVVLAFEPLADDLHVQQTEESAPEPEADGVLRAVSRGR